MFVRCCCQLLCNVVAAILGSLVLLGRRMKQTPILGSCGNAHDAHKFFNEVVAPCSNEGQLQLMCTQ